MVQLALIGVGAWGTQYIDTIKSVQGCNIKYVCSPHIRERRDVEKGLVTLESYEDLVSFSDIDGIIIATPAKTHFTIASYFLKRSYNLLIEKPLTTSLKDALSLKKIAEKEKPVIMVGHIYHYNHSFQKTLLKSRKLGRTIAIESEAGKQGSNVDNLSALWEWGPHDIGMTLEVLGRMPIAVSTHDSFSEQKRDSQVAITLYFSEGVTAFFRLGWMFPKKTRSFRIFCEKGTAIFTDREARSGMRSPLKHQIEDFARCLKSGKKPEVDLKNGIDVVRILHFAGESMVNKGKKVYIR